MEHSKKAYIAPLAMALIVVVIFILIATAFPNVKETAVQIFGAVTGHR